MQKAKIRPIKFLETRKDTPRVLDFVDKALDQMPFSVEPFIILAQEFGTLMRRDNGFNAALQQIVDKILGGIAAICDETLKIKAFQQLLGLGDVMLLPGSQDRVQGIAQPIHRDMYLATEATTSTP